MFNVISQPEWSRNPILLRQFTTSYPINSAIFQRLTADGYLVESVADCSCKPYPVSRIMPSWSDISLADYWTL